MISRPRSSAQDLTATVEARQRAYLARLRAQEDEISIATLAGTLVIPPGVAHPKLDSHLLALAAFPIARGNMLDAFCGSGIVGLSVRNKCEHCVFLDISEAAISACASNAERLGLVNARYWKGTIGSFPLDTLFDLITANPPYSDRASSDTLDEVCYDLDHSSVRNFIASGKHRLAPGGSILISWANFADFSFIEHFLREHQMLITVVAHMEEPSDDQAGDPIEYRVYRCRNG